MHTDIQIVVEEGDSPGDSKGLTCEGRIYEVIRKGIKTGGWRVTADSWCPDKIRRREREGREREGREGEGEEGLM